MRNYVIINGVSSLTIPGLAIRELPAISKTLMRNQKEEIDGRDGDIITELGYSAYDKTMTIGLYGSYDINQIIAFFNQKGTIVFSDEADKYYNFTILEKIDYDKLVKFRTATVKMHCQPFKYPLSETPVEIEAEYVTSQGEDITLNNTGVAALEIGLKGNTYQETTTGKNLFNGWEIGKMISSTNGNISDSTTSAISGYIPVDFTTNTVYRLSGLTNTLNSYVGAYNSSKQFLGRTSATATDFWNLTTSSFGSGTPQGTGDIAYVIVRHYVLSGTSTGVITDVLDLQTQLEAGSQTSSYEEYTGGIPAPNPDFPMPVQVVTGDNTIKVVGKNLFSGNNVTTTHTSNWGITFEDNVLTIEHKNTYSTGTPEIILGKLPSGTYVVSGTLASGVSLYKDGTYEKLIPSGTTFTCNGTQVVSIRFGNSSATTLTYTNMQLERGTTPTEYTPYQNQEYEINLGKNLQQNNWEDGRYNGSGVGTNVHLKINNGNMFQVGKTYTIHFKNTLGVTSSIYLQNTNDEIHLGTLTYNSTTNISSLTITFTQQIINILNGSSVRLACYRNTGITADDISEAMIEAGTTPTSYSEYFPPIELCKIGTYQDYLYKSGGNWYKHTEIGKITLNGSENWNYRNDYQTFYISNATSKGTETPVSNYFKGITSGITSNDNVILFNTTTLFVRYLSMSGVVSDFETWLTNHNTNVYYVLATPTEEQITNAELIEQLNDILNAVSYEDQTNINQENDNLAFILDVSALKKGTDMAVVNNGGNIAAKPIIAVKGNGTLGIYLDNTQMFSLNMTSDITIDTENMEAYDPNTNQLRNRQVTGDYSKFALQPGNNTIKVTGDFTSVTISKYERYL